MVSNFQLLGTILRSQCTSLYKVYCAERTDNKCVAPDICIFFIPCTEGEGFINITPIHTPVNLNRWNKRFFLIPCRSLGFYIFCHLLALYSKSLHLLAFSSSHTFTGGLSLVGIHQGPSLSLAMPQCHRTMVGRRQPSLLMSTEGGWVVCAPMCTCFNHAYYICINTGRKCRLSFTYWLTV